MIVTARRITDEDDLCPHGPFQEIDLDLATHLGVHERQVSKGPRRTLLAKFEGQLYQVKDKDNPEHRRKLLSIRHERPRPLHRSQVRWTLSRYTRDHESIIWSRALEKYLEMVPGWSRLAAPGTWHGYLESNGIMKTSSMRSPHDYAISITDPSDHVCSIFLTEDQAEKIMVLGMP